MDYYFTQNELYWLDHLLPDTTRMTREDNDEDDEEEDEDYKEDFDESLSYENVSPNSKSFPMTTITTEGKSNQ